MTLNDESNESLADKAFNTTQRFVRVTRVRPDCFVEFDFAIGEPELFVELILTESAYADFCATNAVLVLPAAGAELSPDGTSTPRTGGSADSPSSRNGTPVSSRTASPTSGRSPWSLPA